MRRLASMVALVFLTAACSGSAVPTATVTPPISASTTAATTTAIRPPTTTTSSTTTTTATIAIVGDEEFTAHTSAALALLAQDAPGWYAQVIEYIDVVEAVDTGSGMDVLSGTFLVGEVTAYAPAFDADSQIVWFAGTIVHDSCHSRLYSEGEPYTGRDAELACLHDQLGVLEALDRSDYMESYVQRLIDGVDDPGNAYWTSSDRDW